MRILFITPTLPYPLDTGGKIVVFNTLRHLAKKHDLFLLSLIQEGQEEYIRFVSDYCTQVETVLQDISFSNRGLFLNVFSSIPYNMTRYHSEEMENKLNIILSENKFDLLQIEHLHMAQYARFAKGVPVFLRQHNVESLMMERYYRYASNSLERIYAYCQWKKLIRYERKMCLDSDLVIALSGVDQRFIKNLSPQIHTGVVSCGVDFEHFKASSAPREKNKLIYVGGLHFKPAFEGVLYLLNEIWPEIRRACPEAEYQILGKCPPGKLRAIKDRPGVTVSGYVEDVRTAMSTATLGVVPYRIASGVRLKILESMAMKLPLVSTSIGCEGIEVVDGEHIFIADDPKTFAEKVCRLLKDENLRTRLADNAFKLVTTRYTWENAANRLELLYRKNIN